MDLFETAWIFLLCVLVVGALAAATYGMCFGTVRFMFWTGRRIELVLLRHLTRNRVRPDHWDTYLLSRAYQWIGIAFMAVGLLQIAADEHYGTGVLLLAISVWGLAGKANDHAAKYRPIDDAYMLSWWESGYLHPWYKVWR